MTRGVVFELEADLAFGRVVVGLEVDVVLEFVLGSLASGTTGPPLQLSVSHRQPIYPNSVAHPVTP